MGFFWLLLTAGRTVTALLGVWLAAWIWGIPTMWTVGISAVLVVANLGLGIYLALLGRSD